MCIRDSAGADLPARPRPRAGSSARFWQLFHGRQRPAAVRHQDRGHDGAVPCLLYTSDAADERSSVDLGGRRILKKKKNVVSNLGPATREITNTA